MIETLRLVMIEWVDNRHPVPEWRRLSDLDDHGARKCVSVGFLVREDAQSKVIAPNLSSGNGDDTWDQASGLLTIPTAAITKMKFINTFHLSLATEAAAPQTRPLADAPWLRRLA